MADFQNNVSDSLKISISGKEMTESICKLLSVMERICQREGLQFFAFGKLLVYGVQYHRLPDYRWNNIYEVGMLRKDFEVFVNKAEQYEDEMDFRVRRTPIGDARSCYHSPYFYIEQKVIIKTESVAAENWISLRVSPFDKVPMAEDTRVSFYRKMKRQNRCLNRINGQRMYVAKANSSFLKFWLKHLLYGFRDSKKAYNRLSRMAQKYNDTNRTMYQRVVGKKSKPITENELFPIQNTTLGKETMPIPFDVSPWTNLDMNSYVEQGKKLHPVELEILEEMERVCTEMKVEYFLCGGSLLGYQRYGGFIPWDDDIDCGMLRRDYERFCEYADQYIDKERFFLQIRKNDPKMPYLYIKLRRRGTIYETEWSQGRDFHKGIGIDIFPFDYVPNSVEDRKAHCMQAKKIARKHTYIANRAKPNPPMENLPTIKDRIHYHCGNVKRWIFRHISLERTQKKYDAFVKKYNSQVAKLDLQYVASFVPQYSGGEMDTIFPIQKVQFDGVTTRIIHRPEVFLRDQYGDYDAEPMRHQRIGHKLVEVDTGNQLKRN